MGRLSKNQQAAFLSRKGESFEKWLERVCHLLEDIDPDHPDPHSMYEYDNGETSIIQAWDGKGVVEMILPSSKYRSQSECQAWIPPFHFRNEDDEVLDFTVIGLPGRHLEYATNMETALKVGQALADLHLTEVTINNACSNTVFIAEMERLNENWYRETLRTGA